MLLQVPVSCSNSNTSTFQKRKKKSEYSKPLLKKVNICKIIDILGIHEVLDVLGGRGLFFGLTSNEGVIEGFNKRLFFFGCLRSIS